MGAGVTLISRERDDHAGNAHRAGARMATGVTLISRERDGHKQNGHGRDVRYLAGGGTITRSTRGSLVATTISVPSGFQANEWAVATGNC